MCIANGLKPYSPLEITEKMQTGNKKQAHESTPWSNNSPNALLDFVRRACFPSIPSTKDVHMDRKFDIWSTYLVDVNRIDISQQWARSILEEQVIQWSKNHSRKTEGNWTPEEENQEMSWDSEQTIVERTETTKNFSYHPFQIHLTSTHQFQKGCMR